jgi:hypothetical protein
LDLIRGEDTQDAEAAAFVLAETLLWYRGTFKRK